MLKLTTLFLLLAALVCSHTVAVQADTFEVMFRNRTPQTLTPAVCAIHSRRASIFEVGQPASLGLSRLAEDGVSSDLAAELRAQRGVRAVAVGDFVSPGKSGTLRISSRGSGKISCAVGMLVSTNDGFPAFQGRRLPRRAGQRVRFKARAYDAGSEVNTESCDHVPGRPCNAHSVGETEGGTVQRHPGLQGGADLDPAALGWKEPAVRGVIVRLP